MDSLKVVMVDVLGFVNTDDTGIDTNRVIIFSLAGHSHRIKISWEYSGSYYYLTSSILQTDHSTVLFYGKITASSSATPWELHTAYRAVSFNGLKALFIISNTLWVPVMIYTTYGTNKCVITKFQSSYYCVYVVNDGNTTQTSFYYMNLGLMATGNKTIIGPYITRDAANILAADSVLDGVYRNNSYFFGSRGMKIQINDKKFITTSIEATDIAGMIQYE
jgi:hypothetical protein